MRIQKHKRKIHVGAKSRQERTNWESNYDQTFAHCPLCGRSREEPLQCADAFHAIIVAKMPGR